MRLWPEPELLRTPADAKRATAWMRYMGFAAAYPTPPGPDGGVEVDSSGAVAQVKAELLPTGRPRIQQLAGVAAHQAKEALFFSLGGYSREATDWALAAGIAPFTFDLTGEPVPVNVYGRLMLERTDNAALSSTDNGRIVANIRSWFDRFAGKQPSEFILEGYTREVFPDRGGLVLSLHVRG